MKKKKQKKKNKFDKNFISKCLQNNEIRNELN